MESCPPSRHGKVRESSATSPDFDVKSPDLAGKPTDLVGDAKLRGLLELPPELVGKLAGLGVKSGKEDLVEAILELLKWRELSLAELGNYVGRNPDYLRMKYLGELLKAELIQATNPSKPTDPNQKYRAVRRENN